MSIIRFLLISSMLISMFVRSACNPVYLPTKEPQDIKAVFDIYDIPGEDDPPIFFSIDWSWEDKLTIEGWGGTEHNPIFPAFVGDISVGKITPFYLNSSVLSSGSVALISKDGHYLSFQSYEPPSLHIALMDKITSSNYVIRPDSDVDVLVGKNYPCSDRAWSPDSRQLAFVCVDLHDKLTISLYDLTEKSIHNLFEYSEPYLTSTERVSWSSDGTMLAFSLRYGHHNGQASQTDVFVYHFDTGLLVRITNTPRDDEINPDWYPETRIFTYQLRLYDEGEPDSSLVFSTDDGKCKKILPKLIGFVYPSWSPDGSQLAYISDWMDIKVLETSQFVPPDFLSPHGLCASGAGDP